MHRAWAGALIAIGISLTALGCGQGSCADHDCAQVAYRWPCNTCGRPIVIAQGATARFSVGWSRANYGGAFCPAAPSIASRDERVLHGDFGASCGALLVVTGVGPGAGHLDLFDGASDLGWWEMDVAPIDHLAIVPTSATGTERQDPLQREVHVGGALALDVMAYDAAGHPLFADDVPSWQSDDTSVLSADADGTFRAVAAGATDVHVALLGGTATQHVVVLP